MKLVRGSVVLSVPLAAVQGLRLDQPGPYQLGVEGQPFTRAFSGLEFELRSPRGDSVSLPPILMRTSVKSFSRSRLTLRSFSASEPGTYQLTVRGIHPDPDPTIAS